MRVYEHFYFVSPNFTPELKAGVQYSFCCLNLFCFYPLLYVYILFYYNAFQCLYHDKIFSCVVYNFVRCKQRIYCNKYLLQPPHPLPNLTKITKFKSLTTERNWFMETTERIHEICKVDNTMMMYSKVFILVEGIGKNLRNDLYA